ncbi:asl1 [Symbiodinium sp. CCMP2592]|nr:asl1 [Symbiodinium sp. CCMP2592]
MLALRRWLVVVVTLTGLGMWMAQTSSGTVATSLASFRIQAAAAFSAVTETGNETLQETPIAGAESLVSVVEEPQRPDFDDEDFSEEDLLELPLQSIWTKIASSRGLATVARAVCQSLGNRTLPSLFEDLSGRNGSLQEATDRACGFPCRQSSGVWEAVESFSLKERVWLGFMVVQMRNGSILPGNGTCRPDQPSPRVLTHLQGARGQGLGNLLQGLHSALHIAMISGRAFRMKWPRLEDAVRPRFLNWKDPVGAGCKPQLAELWNFGRFQDNFRPTLTLANGSTAMMHFTGNWGMLPPKWGNLSGIGLPDVAIRDAFPQRGQAPGCLLHFALGAKESLLKDVDKALGHQPPGQIALQLRTGDAVKNSISGDGRDKRQVIVNKVWGLDNPKRAATVMAECFRQLCGHLFAQPGLAGKLTGPKCVGLFETDNFDARHTIQALGPQNGATVLRASGIDPRHSVQDSATSITLASMIAMASHEVLLKTAGSIGEIARQLGSGIRPGGRWFLFETFLKERALRNQSEDNVARLCDPAFHPAG